MTLADRGLEKKHNTQGQQIGTCTHIRSCAPCLSTMGLPPRLRRKPDTDVFRKKASGTARTEAFGPGSFRQIARASALEARIVATWGVSLPGFRRTTILGAWRAETELAMALPSLEFRLAWSSRKKHLKAQSRGDVGDWNTSEVAHSFKDVSCRHAVEHVPCKSYSLLTGRVRKFLTPRRA